jgi:hypothetical protein
MYKAAGFMESAELYENACLADRVILLYNEYYYLANLLTNGFFINIHNHRKTTNEILWKIIDIL